MADTKITALTAISTNPVNPATFPIPMVDLLDTSMAASGTTKKVTVNQILGSGGTATLASATITGAATVGTTLGVTGVSTLASAVVTGALTSGTTTLVAHAAGYTGKVGIGTATPVSSLQVLDGDITVTTGGSFCGFNGTRQTVPSSVGTQLSRLHFSAYSTGTTYVQGASIQSYSDAAWSASSAPAYLSFYTTPSASVTLSERMRIEAAGDVKIVTGNVVMATSGKGIDFSAVTGGTGTATANVLNDYEEGTFVPTIAGNTIAGVGVYGDQNGRYTKVGRLVTCQIFVNWTAHTGTGDMRIEGLPFATASISGIYHAATIGWANNIALTAGYVITGYASHNASTGIALQQYPTGGGAMIAVPIDTLGGFIVSISYIT